MRLLDLEPEFRKIVDARVTDRADSIAEADGVMFLCPKCFQKNGGRAGTHSIVCWQPHVPAERSPGPGRWTLQGTGLHDLSLVAGSSSVALTGGCAAHFFVENGAIRMV